MAWSRISGSDTYTNTVSSGDTSSDQSYDGEAESGGQPLSATSTATNTDSGGDSSWSYDHGTDIPLLRVRGRHRVGFLVQHLHQHRDLGRHVLRLYLQQ